MKQGLIWVSVLWLYVGLVAAEEPRLVIDTGGHQALIWEVLFTSDGKYLVSAGEDKVIRVWDVQTGATVRTIRGQIGDGQAGKIYAAALSRGDRYLAVGGFLAGEPKNRHAVRIHDFQSGEVRGLLTGHTNVIYALAFSADGRYLASGSYDRTIRIWEMEQMRQVHVLTGHTDFIYAVAFSPDDTRLVSGSDDHTLRLWDVKQGTLLKTMQGHEDRVRAAAFSPDGRYIASGSWDKTVRLWDARTGDVVKLLGRQETQVSSLSFSPDSRWLLTGSGGSKKATCTVFAVPSGDVITRFTQHENIVQATAVSPDGALVATGGGNNQEIYLWKPRKGQVVKQLVGKGHNVWSVGFARDGRSIAFGNVYEYRHDYNNRGPLQHSVLLKQAEHYQVTLGSKVKTESDYFRAIERYGDYRLQTKQGGAYGYWAILQVMQGEKVLHEIERDSTSGYDHRAYTFTHDGRFIVSGGTNGSLSLYDRDTGKEVRPLVGHTGNIWAVAVAPDNRTVVSGSTDQTIRLWDLATGANLLSIFVGSDQEWVAWTPQGYYTSSLKGDAYIG